LRLLRSQIILLIEFRANGIDKIINKPFFSREDEMMNDYALRELRPNIKDKLKDYILKRNKKKQTRIRTKTCKNLFNDI